MLSFDTIKRYSIHFRRNYLKPMKRAWHKYRKRRYINSSEFHEWVAAQFGMMLFDPKDIQQLNITINE